MRIVSPFGYLPGIFGKSSYKVSLLLLACLTTSTLLTPAAHAQAPAPAEKAGVTEDEVRRMYADILKAIEEDDTQGVIKVLAAGFPVDITDKDGNTLLMQAAKGGKAKAAAALLSGLANVDVMAKNGVTALMLACNGGHVEAARVLLASKADPNLRGKDMPSAMHLAAVGNHVEVLKSLIKMGADVNVKDGNGFTPLEMAFLKRAKESLAYLRPVYKDKEPNSIVWTTQTLNVALSGKKSQEVLKLLAFGIDPNAALDKDGTNTPLETAINFDHVDGVALLLLGGADPNRLVPGAGIPVWWLAMTVNQGKTPDARILNALLKTGASLTTASAKGVTPLAYAKSQPDPEIAKALIAAGAK